MSRIQILVLLMTAFACRGIAQNGYTISYAGRTFGYFRVPSIQQDTGNHCDSSAVDLPQVRTLLQQAAAGGKGGLVALGDNFAPELGARSIQLNGRFEPKDQLTFDYLNTHHWISYLETSPGLERAAAHGQEAIDFDNVGCFFKLAGFDAIVPGKLDFHYGPQRLQELARYLADPTDGKPVQMLGANIAITTVINKPPAQTRPSPKPENYAYGGPGGSSFNLPSVPLPFLRTFPIANGISVKGFVQSSAGEKHLQRLTQGGLAEGTQKTSTVLYSRAWICQGELGPRFNPSGCTELSSTDSQGTTLNFKLPTDRFGLFPGPTAVQPGVNYYVCASSVGEAAAMKASNTICHATFQFHYPFFQWGKAGQPNPKLYVALDNVVIFGVVDPEFSTQIAALDQTWLNADYRFKTQLEIIDPLDAISQLQQTCQEDPACAGKRRVLLAQMDPERAQRFATHLAPDELFDIVISQADGDSATGNLTREDRSENADLLKPLVVTPNTPVASGSPDTLNVALSSATVTRTPTERSFRNEAQLQSVTIDRQTYTGKTQLWELFVQSGLTPAPEEKANVDGRAIVQTGILNVMRQYCKADVALLQDRDLYRPEYYAIERPTASQLQDLLDRLLWKGDFISCRPEPGSALKQATAVSNQFAAGAKNDLAERANTGYVIEMLGMFSHPTSGLVTDGTAVQDARQYSVAMTDFLASGQSGYTALASATNPEQIESSDFNEITALVCRSLIDQLADAQSNSCRGPLRAEAYLDPIEMQPYSIPEGLNFPGELREWASENWKTQKILAPVSGNPAEFQAENSRVLTVRLDHADLGYQRNLHSLDEIEQQQRFSGVQAAQPTAAERFDWSADYLIRLTSSGKNVDRFIQADAAYEDSGVKQVFTTATGTSETYQISLPQNSAGLEIGLQTRVFPKHQKNITGITLLTSFRYQTEISRPFVQFEAQDGFLNESVPRANQLLAKAGLRYDGTKSWLELGMQSGPQTQIQSFTLGPNSCDPSNVALCLSPAGATPLLGQVIGQPFHVETLRRDESGVFFNGHIHLPILYKHLDYVIDNQGILNFNRAGDSAADTRYLEVMTHSLVIPVIGDLSIAPKVDIFFFQNKVAGWHIHGYQTSVTAQYRFDWHTGLRWKDVLRYPAPPSQ